MNNDVNNILNHNIEVSEAEYKRSYAKASKNASVNYDKKKNEHVEKVSEATKHKRIQSNFYGSAINILIAIYDQLQLINEHFEKINNEG